MENKSEVFKRNDHHLELPPGFRFHPTDEELITHYLSNKVIDSNFSAIAIGQVDMNKVEPWELPCRAKLGEKEWYFFCVRDKKYPNGQRTNRATPTGYWKATGKDREIFRGKTLVGMKKTLVFYRGRAPRGEKSRWVAHEYRLEGDKLPESVQNDWVISRVFQKTSGGEKIDISGLMRMDSRGNELNSPTLPPLIDSSSLEPQPGHVHCFSRPITAPQNIQEDFVTCFNDPIFPASVNSSFPGNVFPELIPFENSTISRNYEQNLNQGFRKERVIVSVSQETDSCVVSNHEMEKKPFEENGAPATSVGSQDFDCIWSY